jgi:hypothetical protein
MPPAPISTLAAAAIELNARANGCRVTAVRRDVLDDERPTPSSLPAIAGTTPGSPPASCRGCTGARSRDRRPWATRADSATDELVELAAYDVRTTTDLQD